MTTRDAVLAALPGTSAQIAERTKMGIGSVRRTLRRLQDRGEVRRFTERTGSKGFLGTTYIYRRQEEGQVQ